ncbi:MAG: hypothetical protein ABIL15_08030 [candidate division WOR-3 bacterium]
MVVLFLLNLYIVDQPDINIMEHGKYSLQLRFGPKGEILGFGSIGLWNRLLLGMSYGASNLIGAGNPGFYKYPGVQARLAVLEPDLLLPSFILGFDNQGYGEYDTGLERYAIMSKGLYCQVGKNFDYAEFKIIPSFGINYSFEQSGRIDIFGGIIFEISSTQFLIDFTPNFNDDNYNDTGYLNTGLKFIFYEQLFFEFDLRDLLENIEGQQLNRMIKIGYEDTF